MTDAASRIELCSPSGPKPGGLNCDVLSKNTDYRLAETSACSLSFRTIGSRRVPYSGELNGLPKRITRTGNTRRQLLAADVRFSGRRLSERTALDEAFDKAWTGRSGGISWCARRFHAHDKRQQLGVKFRQFTA
jgi:hypothetical protein